MKKNKKLGLIVSVLLLAVGVTFAIFTSNIFVGGEGSEQEGVTVAIEGATINVTGTLSFNDTDILPGHKTVSAIKVTAKGDNELIPYNLVWKGTNSLNTTLNYTVYKTSSNINVNASCNKKKKIENGKQILNEECSLSNIESLGTPVGEGSIETSTTETKITLVEDEFVTATPTGLTMYYYIVLEYPNLNNEQNLDIGGSFGGVLTVEESSTLPDINILAAYIEQDDGTYKESKDIPASKTGYSFNVEKSTCSNEATPEWDYSDWSLKTKNLTKSGTSCYLYFSKGSVMEQILNDYNTSARTNFSTVYTDTMSKTIFTTSDWVGTSKYFAGAPTDNYVKFGGFYWRIIRMNGDKTTRLIYAGKANVIDGLTNKEAVLANSYDDSVTKYTNALSSKKFNTTGNDNAYVGFMYTVGSLRGTTNKSDILKELDAWYETNLKTEYSKYIDGGTGFCGDRTAYTDQAGTTSGGGTGTTKTYYGSFIRLCKNGSSSNAAPSLSCSNSSDLYTTSSSTKGNKALTNPIGLITADEVAFAGGAWETYNEKYYLHTNNYYWTLSPYGKGDLAAIFAVYSSGQIHASAVSSNFDVRPVINLSSNTRFVGSGTWDDPFTVI